MCETDTVEHVVHILVKLYIMANATKLGWTIELQDNKIILTKLSSKLTRLDKNTPRLLKALIRES
jgi:hypothetical protein